MSRAYQTVLYFKSSGQILSVQNNLYIRTRKHLAQLSRVDKAEGVGYIYFPYTLVIDPLVHAIKRLSPNLPPSLVSSSGIPLDFELIMNERRSLLLSGANVLVEFEGGMGDQLMEAAAVLSAIKQYPASSFSIMCNGDYVNILQRVLKIPPVSSVYVGASRDAFTCVVSNHTNYMSDPRGLSFGKASLYGAWLGLDKVSNLAKLKFTSADFKSESDFFSHFDFGSGKLNVMCQFRSGSGHGKSWQAEKIIKLCSLFKADLDCNFFVVGLARELPRDLPDIIDLTGRSTWWQTCLLESKMDLIICIDSGVMHMARSLSLPYVCLWGGTNSQMILGIDEQDCDIRLPLDCLDLVCYDCPRGTCACMEKITPEMVMKNARLLYHKP